MLSTTTYRGRNPRTNFLSSFTPRALSNDLNTAIPDRPTYTPLGNPNMSGTGNPYAGDKFIYNSPTQEPVNTPQVNTPHLYTPPRQGLVTPRNLSLNTQAAPLSTGIAKTPQQLAQEANGATTGIGSQAPVAHPYGQVQTTAPVQTTPTATLAAAPTQMSGLVQNAINQAKGYYQQQQGLTTQAQDIAKKIGEEQAAITGQYQGTASDEAGRIAQLEQIKQGTLANIGQQEAKLSGFEAPLASLYGTSIGAARPTGAFPFVFNPLTGKFDTAGAGATAGAVSPTLTYNPTQDAQTLAEHVINGTIPYKDAQTAMAYAGGVGSGLLQEAITNAGGNVTQLEAQANATQANVGTQNTAQASTLSNIYNTTKQKVYALNNSLNDIESLGKLTLNTVQGGSINPTHFATFNQTIADLRRELTSPAQAAFDSNMANFQSSLSAIYANTSGAVPTQITKWGTEIANGSMPLGELKAVYDNAVKEGNLRLGNLNNTANSAYNQLQGIQGTQTTTGGTTGGTTGSNTGGTNGDSFSNANFYGS